VARALAQQSPPVEVSGSLIWRLHRGKSQDASLRLAQALARFFGVPASYFLLDDAQAPAVEQDPALQASLRDERIRAIALALRGLSPSSLDAIAALVDAARAVEQLPAARPSSRARSSRSSRRQ
jgi:hypothetical protein